MAEVPLPALDEELAAKVVRMAPLNSTLCIFCKPPGQSKSRLVPSVGPTSAARLAEAMLRDSVSAAVGVEGAQVILAMTEDFDIENNRSISHWLQPTGDLGQRVEAVLQRALRAADCALAIGADTPGLRSDVLEQAIQCLEINDAVIGPARDGGFYLLGLRSCPDLLFRHIRWSCSNTFDDTIARFKLFGLTFAVLEEWFDLDTYEDLQSARRMLSAGEIVAPHLAAALHHMDEARSRA